MSGISRRQFLTGRLSGVRPHADPAQPRRAAIAPGCLALNRVVCRSCGEVCEARAIRFAPAVGGASAPEVDPALCNGCGACVGACPAAAVSLVAAA
jgi:ferredoxin-type protein NapF